MGLLVCMVVMLLLMESGSIKVFAAGALLGLWLGCMRMVESESVKERKAGARVRLWVKRGNDWVGVGYQDFLAFPGSGYFTLYCFCICNDFVCWACYPMLRQGVWLVCLLVQIQAVFR